MLGGRIVEDVLWGRPGHWELALAKPDHWDVRLDGL